MTAGVKLSHTAALILHAVGVGYGYGFSIMEVTGLASGTIYPALRRLEQAGLIRSRWEKQSLADAEQRPPRKYYTLSREGGSELQSLQKRYPLLEKSIQPRETEHA